MKFGPKKEKKFFDTRPSSCAVPGTSELRSLFPLLSAQAMERFALLPCYPPAPSEPWRTEQDPFVPAFPP